MTSGFKLNGGASRCTRCPDGEEMITDTESLLLQYAMSEACGVDSSSVEISSRVTELRTSLAPQP